MNGKVFLIYTTEEGGFFKLTCGSKDDVRRWYETAARTGRLQVPHYDGALGWAIDTPVVLVALATVSENFDVLLGCSREIALAPPLV